MLKLRPYQETPVRMAIDFFLREGSGPALMVMPTAFGKSIVAAEAAAACPDPILVVQPTKELLEQNLAKYRLLCGDLAPAGVYSASFGKKQIDHVTFATIGSIKNVGADFRRLGFRKMLIDEAHLYPRKEESMLGQFLSESGISHVLGITATPLKLETFSSQKLVPKKYPDGSPVIGRDGRPVMTKAYDGYSKLTMLTNPSADGSFYTDILYVGQIQEMTSMGFWSPLLYDVVPFDTSPLRMNSGGSEFTEKSELTAYEVNDVHHKILECLDLHPERKHVLVFVPSVEEASLLASEYPGSAVISGETPKKERAETFRAFRAGEIRVLFGVSVFGTGFDYTKIDMLILAFSTASIARYYQYVGRAVRIDPEKKDALVVDMCGNVPRFGYVEDIYFEWDGIWRMYGTGGMLLSGIPVDCIGSVHRDDVGRMMHWPNIINTFPFGKYKNLPLEEVPHSYLRWYLRKAAAEGNPDELQLLDKVRIMLECDVRDTTREPAVLLMPTGIHQGKALADVPKGYLWWFYKNTRWTRYNDSLRRGVEGALKEADLF